MMFATMIRLSSWTLKLEVSHGDFDGTCNSARGRDNYFMIIFYDFSRVVWGEVCKSGVMSRVNNLKSR